MGEFSHFTRNGVPQMVDVTDKKVTSRMARATGFVRMEYSTVEKIEKNLLPKGNLFEIAKIAGIMGAKKNSDLIPLCHPLALSYVDVEVIIDHEKKGIRLNSEVRLEGKTGAEMEALVAVTIAALTVYDMCKAVDKNMVIEDIMLVEKTGGKSDYKKE